MNLLLQRNWHLSARLDGKELISDATYCGTDRELTARLNVEPASLRISKAVWEVYRAPGFDGPRACEIPQIRGVEAYFGCGSEIRNGLAFLNDLFAEELFMEAVRAVIQAETFLYKERGFSAAEEFEKYWTDNFKNSCRYYSNLDQVSRDWYEHVGYDKRYGNLFNRTKTQILFKDNISYTLAGYFNDSFHGLAVELALSESGMVENAGGKILRAPDSICKEAPVYLNNIIGKKLTLLSKKDIVSLLGNSQGCIHLIDLVTGGAETFRLFVRELRN